MGIIDNINIMIAYGFKHLAVPSHEVNSQPNVGMEVFLIDCLLATEKASQLRFFSEVFAFGNLTTVCKKHRAFIKNCMNNSGHENVLLRGWLTAFLIQIGRFELTKISFAGPFISEYKKEMEQWLQQLSLTQDEIFRALMRAFSSCFRERLCVIDRSNGLDKAGFYWAQVAQQTRAPWAWHKALIYAEMAKDYENVGYCRYELAKITNEAIDWDNAALSYRKAQNLSNEYYCWSQAATLFENKRSYREAGFCHNQIANITYSPEDWGRAADNFHLAIEEEESWDKKRGILKQFRFCKQRSGFFPPFAGGAPVHVQAHLNRLATGQEPLPRPSGPGPDRHQKPQPHHHQR